METTKLLQQMTITGFLVETPDGKHKLAFETMIEAQRVQAALDHAMLLGHQAGEDETLISIDYLRESLKDHAGDVTELLEMFGRVKPK